MIVLALIFACVTCVLLTFVVWSGCRELVRHHQHMHAEPRPHLLSVRGLAVDPPRDRVVDGIVMTTGDLILQNKMIWMWNGRKWIRSDLIKDAVPGTQIHVTDGLRYAHSMFVLVSNGNVVPAWQHWMNLQEPVTNKNGHVEARSDKTTCFT